MRIGLLVDGDAEKDALPGLIDELQRQTGHTILRPLRPPIHPKAPIGNVAHVCEFAIAALVKKKVDLIVVLLDREDRNECPTQIAKALAEVLRKRATVEVTVVVKDRCFENWLLADPDALAASPRRFQVSRAIATAARSGLTDDLDALRKIEECVMKDRCNKKLDSVRILQQAHPDRMARGSRSFRRFLRCLGHPRYRDQSKQWAG